MLRLIKSNSEVVTPAGSPSTDRANFARFGRVVSIAPSRDSVEVDFEGNPYQKPIPAKIGRQFQRSELELAIENTLNCRIEFLNGDIDSPILTDVFFSLVESDQPLVIKATDLILHAEQELTIKTRNCETVYNSVHGQVTTKARYITSQAEKSQKIQGATISMN